MSGPFTAAGICNRAFHLAEHAREIESLDEGSGEAKLAKLHFDTCRQIVLKAVAWQFATEFLTEEAVVLNAATPSRFPYVYQLSGEVLRVVRIVDVSRQSWRVAGKTNRLHCPFEPPIVIEAVTNVVEPGRFEPEFVNALEHLLASRFAARYSRSANRRQLLEDRYDAIIEEAQESEGVETGDAFWDDAASHDWRDDFGPRAYSDHY